MKDKDNRAFCLRCAEWTPYNVICYKRHLRAGGVRFEYRHKLAICPKCGLGLYAPSINDANAKARVRAFRIASRGAKR